MARVNQLRQKPKYEYIQSIQWQKKVGRKWMDIPGATDEMHIVRGKYWVRVNITYTKKRIFVG